MLAVVVDTPRRKHAATPRTVMRFLDSRFARSMTEVALHKNTQRVASTLMSVSHAIARIEQTMHGEQRVHSPLKVGAVHTRAILRERLVRGELLRVVNTLSRLVPEARAALAFGFGAMLPPGHGRCRQRSGAGGCGEEAR